MRLFVALVPPPDVLEDLGRVADGLRAAAGPEQNALRWTTVEQWHLTLAFLGEVDDQRLPELDRRLRRAASRSEEALALRLAKGGGFGSARAARVLWVGLSGDVQPLRRLADGVGAAARRSGIDVETRRFRPHVTIARLKQPGDVRPLVERLATYSGPEWQADRIQLIRSYRGQGEGHRPRYETIGAWPLGKRAEPAEPDQE
jgi:RNA 2',3'-cyclic 3'-phosphodiesterase